MHPQEGCQFMRLFGWFRRPPSDETTPQPVPRRWRWLGGRRVLTDTPYILPKDKAEGDRLDLQHHLFKLAAGGNYRAPIRQPRAILDVACGTGIWGREMAQQFKRARVVGFDIDRTPMERSLELLGPKAMFPPNFTFLTADALKPFPFEDGEFDFTHARLISPFLPIEKWPFVVSEMVRVTKLGGHVEIVDGEVLISPSPAFMQLYEAVKKLLVGRGLHAGAAPYLAGYLRQAGLTHIQERKFTLGAGRSWERQQRLLMSDMLAAFANMQPIMVKAGIHSDAEYSAILAQARAELPKMGLTWPVAFVFGQKL
jgi:ubiquinone/menaquinone biosynthesis C-methylase UbiE